MKLKVITILIIALSFSSCKKDGDATTESSKTKEAAATDDFFRVAFDLVIKKDDNMHLYYTLDGSINFNEEQSLWVPVKGSENVQEVVFVLPEDIIPSLVRVDFGHGKNETQSDVELKTFRMTYQGKKAEFAGPAIFEYFTPFEGFTEIIPGTSTLKRSKKDQESAPILYPKNILSEKINELTGGQSPE